ncbi:hypothetical protein GCM10010371_17100 [Streptomyces subrutilus]|uniref:Uncharacterized protein n=1 Tax=Streptomyces subrutilus TaxID=36818 RepID=A0A5P2UJX7_9ACTN|nr:hypothetical protein [Streptomyces subrutilus]QEU78729.1 hypothetical protein CP968_10860 [Streptomyces subrutilus]GGZ58164.1 hypothetical protein GCM10010371_17100 [Streptomyces subrutilus]
MIIALVIACEVGFWVLLAAGLALRYLAKRPRAGAAVLLCEPLLELVLLVVTALDLKNGAEPDWKHGLAALYIGYTVAYGHYTVKWLDGHAAHRLGGGPKPPGAGYGRARAVHEWKLWLRTLAGAAVALALLQGAIRYVGAAGDVSTLEGWQFATLRVVALHALIAVGYTVWPKKAPARAEDRPAPARADR